MSTFVPALALLVPLLPLAHARGRGKWADHVWGRLNVPNVTEAVRRAVARPTPLVPPGVVMLSEANEYHAPLLVLQWRRLRELHGESMLQRLVAVCWGRATRLLRPEGLSRQCVEGPAVPKSDMQRDFWTSLVWSKWEVMCDALLAARAALWLDADVALLRNPFAALAAPLWQAQAELLYQPEHAHKGCQTPPGAPCTASPCVQINSGQMLVSSLALARAARAAQPENITNGRSSGRLEQDRIRVMVDQSGFRACPMPASAFVANCALANKRTYAKRGLELPLARLCSVATFHANCLSNAQGKRRALEDIVNRSRAECGTRQ